MRKSLNCYESQSLIKAVKTIASGDATKVEINNEIKAYKVPSNNPNKYTIRIDIKVEEDK